MPSQVRCKLLSDSHQIVSSLSVVISLAERHPPHDRVYILRTVAHHFRLAAVTYRQVVRTADEMVSRATKGDIFDGNHVAREGGVLDPGHDFLLRIDYVRTLVLNYRWGLFALVTTTIIILVGTICHVIANTRNSPLCVIAITTCLCVCSFVVVCERSASSLHSTCIPTAVGRKNKMCETQEEGEELD